MVDVGNLKIIISAVDKVTTGIKSAQKGITDFNKKNRTAAVAMTAMGVGGVIALKNLAKASVDFETAFTGVRKTVDLTESEFADLEQRFKDLSTIIPISFIELSEIGEIAGQLGVTGVDNLEKFTKTIADISATTTLTRESAATDFARIATVMQEPIENVDRMGSVVVELGNSFAANETEIVTFAQRIAGAGKIAGMTTPDLFAIGTALAAVGVQAEAGGTAVQTALLTMNEAVTTGGEELELLAKTAGMTSEEFSKTYKEDASKAFESFILGLGKQGDAAVGTLDDLGLGGIRLKRSFLSLAGAGDLITETFAKSDEQWIENNALIEEAEKRYGTAASQMQMTENQMANLKDALGDELIPMLISVLKPISDMIKYFSDLEPATKKMIIVAGLLTTAFMFLAPAIMAAGIAFNVLMSPITLILLAIAALAVAVIFIWKKWDWLGEKLGWLRDALFFPIAAIKIFTDNWDKVSIAIEAVVGWFKTAWDWLVKLGNKFSESGVADFLSKYKEFATTSPAETMSGWLGFQQGGVVPGSGPVPIMAHGGETVLPRGVSPININITTGPVSSEIDIENLALVIGRKIEERTAWRSVL